MNTDPLKIFERARMARDNAAEMARRWERVTRRVFDTADGREWLTLAMGRMNFMGSVFDSDDGMNAHNAAYRDGMRAVLSDILNTLPRAAPAPPTDDD